MKNIVIVGSKNSGNKNDPSVIAAAFDGEANCTVIYWEDLLISVKTGQVEIATLGRSLLSFDPDLVIAVGWYKSGKLSLYKDLAYSLALYLESHRVEFWNREMIEQRSTSKLSNMVQLALEGVSVPNSLFSLSLSAHVDLSFPCIVKAVAASRGDMNFMVNSQEEFDDIAQGDSAYLVQPFLPNDHDLRVICIGGEAQLILKRQRSSSSTTHLNNTSQGGSAQWIEMDEVDPQLLTISSKICKIMSRELAGIDFIPDESSSYGYSCLEVNAIPQLTSGVDVTKKLTHFRKATINYLGDR